MVSIEIIKKIEGLQTVNTLMKRLDIKRSTAINLMHNLKKQGFVEKKGGGKQPRIYKISAFKQEKRGNPGMYDLINRYSPLKIRAINRKMISKNLSIEEVIVRAILTKDYRTILASLALFNHVTDWHRLYQLAKEQNIRRKTGALYEVARYFIKVRKMDGKTKRSLLDAKQESTHIVEGLRSDDFKELEKRWKVFIPFNKRDMMRLKE